jgi:HEAT repeat protein
VANIQASDSALKLELAAHGFTHTPAEVRRMQAGRAFCILGSLASNATPALIQIYAGSSSVECRRAAADALAEIGAAAKDAVPVLMENIGGTNAEGRALAAKTLGRIGCEPKTVVPLLLGLLSDKDREVRYSAAYALGAMGDPLSPVVSALMETLRDNDAIVRAAAAKALGEMRSEPELVVRALAESLSDANEFVRDSAVEGIAHIGSAGLRPLLGLGLEPSVVIRIMERALSVTEPGTRLTAADTLRKFGPKAQCAVPALIYHFRDPDLQVREAVTNALIAIDPQNSPNIGVK